MSTQEMITAVFADFDVTALLKDLVIILLAAKILGELAKKCRIPAVVGQILAGLLLSFTAGSLIFTTEINHYMVKQFAEIGVVLLMFCAGLGTSLKDLKETGAVAFAVACAGVFIPLALGTGLYLLFWPATDAVGFYKALFVGNIMTATSVSITVQSLRELGHLKGKIGTTIMSAAIIDDVIGIVVMTIVLGIAGGEGETNMLSGVMTGWGMSATIAVLLETLLYFALVALICLPVYKLFKWLDTRFPKSSIITAMCLIFCFAMAWGSKEIFGIADITGAYIAGILFCSLKDASYISERTDNASSLIFAPLFFANVGLNADFSGGVSGQMLLFSVCFVVVALLGKIVGCGATARACGIKGHHALKVGVGMMTRGEVALVVFGYVSSTTDSSKLGGDFALPVVLLILVSSILTPIILKALYAKDGPEDADRDDTASLPPVEAV